LLGNVRLGILPEPYVLLVEDGDLVEYELFVKLLHFLFGRSFAFGEGVEVELQLLLHVFQLGKMRLHELLDWS